jgi:molecular chaperone DnaK
MAEPTEKPPRGPVNLRIKFRSGSLDQFIERYAVDVSRGGIFIRTREPLSVGTRLKFEFQLLDAAPLLAGEGTVVWIRENDPARANVTPGMGVRFDKLSAECQPTLEKILAEKTRLEQAGATPTGLGKSSGGMAVRRTSGVFPAVDPAGVTKPAIAVAPAADPTAGAEPAPGSNAPRSTSQPFTGSSKTSFLASRASSPPPPAAGGFTNRTRTTTGGSVVRPAPVPSALFEPPTADDIDKALEALHEEAAPGSSGRPAAAPGVVTDELSNEPTRVVAVADQASGGSAAHAAPADGADDSSAAGAPESSVPEPTAEAEGASELDSSAGSAPDETAPTAEPAAVRRKIAPEKSMRFRAASAPYPTLRRRRITFSFVIVAVGTVAIVGVLKLHWKERLFPPHPAPAPMVAAPVPAALPPAVPAPPTPAPNEPAPSMENAAPAPGADSAAPSNAATAEGAGGKGATPKSPVPSEGAALPQEKPALAVKPASDQETAHTAEDRPAPKRSGTHRHPQETPPEAAAEENGSPAASTSKAAAGEQATASPKAASGKSTGEKTPAGEKAPGDKATVAEKAATAERSAAPADKAPAADDKAVPAEAAAPAPPILKITSSPAGAEVLIDGMTVGSTPYVSKSVDPTAPHTITVKKDGFDPHERMIGGLDWSRPRGNTPQTLKVNVKLHRTPAAAPATPKENGEPADDTGGPYIKEIKPDAP